MVGEISQSRVTRGNNAPRNEHDLRCRLSWQNSQEQRTSYPLCQECQHSHESAQPSPPPPPVAPTLAEVLGGKSVNRVLNVREWGRGSLVVRPWIGLAREGLTESLIGKRTWLVKNRGPLRSLEIGVNAEGRLLVRGRKDLWHKAVLRLRNSRSMTKNK
nr:hypothetical protein Iba_chr07eCG5580 [Ipomoea batatas]